MKMNNKIIGLAASILLAGVCVQAQTNAPAAPVVPVVVYVDASTAAEMQSMLSNGVDPGEQLRFARQRTLDAQKYWLVTAVGNAPYTNILAIDSSVSNYVVSTFPRQDQRSMAARMVDERILRITTFKDILKAKAELKKAGITSTNAVVLPPDQQ